MQVLINKWSSTVRLIANSILENKSVHIACSRAGGRKLANIQLELWKKRSYGRYQDRKKVHQPPSTQISTENEEIRDTLPLLFVGQTPGRRCRPVITGAYLLRKSSTFMGSNANSYASAAADKTSQTVKHFTREPIIKLFCFYQLPYYALFGLRSILRVVSGMSLYELNRDVGQLFF